MAANSAVHGWIMSNFELIRNFIVVLVTCRNADEIKNEGARVFTALYIDFSRRARAGNSILSGRMWLKKIQTKMKALEWSQHFSYCKSMGEFFKRVRVANSALHGQIKLNFELSPDFMVVHVTCKNEEDLIKQVTQRATIDPLRASKYI